MPRYRQKLSFPRFEMGRPLWVDDPSFNIGYHVRHTALPAPGSVEQLRLLVSRIFSQRLDRSKPLWELWLIEGYEGGFAIVSKVHHAVVDGVSGADLTTVLFDLSKDGTEVPPPERAWSPAPEPSDAQVVAKGAADLAGAPVGLARRALGAVIEPGRARSSARARWPSGDRRDRLGHAEQRAADAAERADRPAPAGHLGADAPGRAQADQERARRHRERRVPGHGGRSAAQLAAHPRDAHRGAGDPLRGARVGARGGRRLASWATRSR